MGFEKTLFTGLEEGPLAVALGDWLTANASDLFTSINGLTCKISDNASIVFTTETPHYIINMANGNKYKSSGNSSSFESYYTYNHAIKTDNGINIYSTDYGDHGNLITISKTNDNSVIISATAADGYDVIRYIFCPEKNIALSLPTYKRDMTTFCPVPLEKDCYSENLLWTPFCQYADSMIEDLLDANGQHYFYDGFCALKY